MPKLPSMGQQLVPFAVWCGSMLACTRLTRTNGLVVARAAGVSVWQFLMPAIAVAVMLGALTVGVFNPVSSVMTARFNVLEDTVLHNRVDRFTSLGQDCLWLPERNGESKHLPHALAERPNYSALPVVLVIIHGHTDQILARFEARHTTPASDD